MKPASLPAADPQRNATVHASAGTGKTWLLVTRMVRLLLAGERVSGILAVTFTRKAAAEMLERLNERLAGFAAADDDSLNAQLAGIGLAPTADLRSRARHLYEELLFSEQGLRTTTFHAFCQEILQRFPVEAEVPPGFELLEGEASLRELAWTALYADATAQPDSAIGQALETLFDSCNGLSNTRTALNSFLSHRIDWWAYTADKEHPVAWSAAALAAQLEIDPDQDPTAGFFHDLRLERIRQFSALLGRNDNKTNLQHQRLLEQCLDETDSEPRLALLREAMLTGKGEPRKRAVNKTVISKLGEANAEQFIAQHEALCDELLELDDLRKRHQTLAINRAWYSAGQALLQHYQRIKQEQRLLDFADLEWGAYRLLNKGEHAHWVQYKLDARIDHLLVDEFQDTNPTQWRLLLPLLEELAATQNDERSRSVFLVGDAKQSIYRFRRADARLLGRASDWLRDRLEAEQHSLDRSRRSSQAVIDCVNRVFGREDRELIPDFPEHGTFNTDLWGRVELLPLISADPDASDAEDAPTLRNPLLTPRLLEEDQRHYHEGQRIAAIIRQHIEQGTVVVKDGVARPIRYLDFLILLRHRTHAYHYERALRDAGIPYLGAARGALLESLEARDLEALLNTLVTPFNNLALAQVLRCPLFSCSDDDLMLLARTPGDHWLQRLLSLADSLPPEHTLARAARRLREWREWAGYLPVHDLLDRIYFDGDLLRRYLASTPENLQPRVQANLLRFLELALQIDSGRYPSLPRFIAALAELREQAEDAPNDATPTGGSDRVRFMTVHGSKGLEAPVVFLADAANTPRPKDAWSALVDWPANRERPAWFLLRSGKEQRDSITAARQAEQDRAAQREDANLLYVALTRARQCLYITGTEPTRGEALGWYGVIRSGLDAAESLEQGASFVMESGTPADADARPAAATLENLEPPPGLQQPIATPRRERRIAPSRQVDFIEADSVQDPDARERGIAVHRLLELMSPPHGWAVDEALPQVARELQRAPDDQELLGWLAQAEQTLAHPDCAALFSTDSRSYAEVPIQYMDGDTLVDGIIDRLLVSDSAVHIIDYKTRPVTSAAEASQHAQDYQQQMALYREGIRRLWPDRTVSATILFTHGPYRIDLDRH